MPAKTSGGFLVSLLGHLFPWRNRSFAILLLFLSLPLGFAHPAFGQNSTNVSTLVFPPNNAVNVDTSKPFGWTLVSGADAYYLYIGTTAGMKDVYDSGELAVTTIRVPGLVSGKQYYVRLWTKYGGVWRYVDSTFTAGTGIAFLLYPQENASNIDPYVTFRWTSISEAQAFYLYVGTSVGAKDAYDSGSTNQTSLLVTSLSANTQYYVRLWTEISGIWQYVDSAFCTGTGIAQLIRPPDNAVDVDPQLPFSWTVVADAQAYYLYVGSSVGAKDVYDSGHTLDTNRKVPGLRAGQKYYVRLWTEKASVWSYVDSTFQTGTGIARLIYPQDKATGVDPNLTLTWSTVPDAITHYLYVGTTPGGKDVGDSGETMANSWPVSSLVAGKTYYVRMWTKKSSGWVYADSSFVTGTGIGTLIYPADKAVDVDVTVAFSWTSISDAQVYYLYVGSALGAKDVYDGGETTATSAAVTGLVSGTQYYVRIWTKKAGAWNYRDSTFQAGSGNARLSYPQDDAVNVDPYVPFTWNAVPNVGAYYLYVGSTPGAKDVFNSGEVNATSIPVWGLVPGQNYFARLWTKKNGRWYVSDTTFQTAPDNLPDQANFYPTIQNLTAQVRGMTDGPTNNPLVGSLLTSQVASRGTTKATCLDYATVLAELLYQNRISARLRVTTFNGTSFDAHTTVEYHDPFWGKWAVADPTFGVTYFDDAKHQGQSVEDISQYVLTRQFSTIGVKPVTSYGTYFLTSYYMDPVLLYLNVVPPNGSLADIPNNPPDDFPILQTQNAVVGVAGVYLFRFSNQLEKATISNSGALLQVQPEDSTTWSASVYLSDGWLFVSVPPDLQVFTLKRALF